jgi:ABC-type nitrate/sulfonate/bicarbonate transport system substrate-binding protein
VYPFVFIAPASIKTPADLKGKTIGVSTIGDSSDTATRQVLKKAGLDPSKDITIIATGSPQNRSAALIAGAIQGGMVAPPDNLTLEAQGMHEIPELSTTKLPAATQVETVLRPYVTAHRDVVQAYMDSIIEGVAAAKADRTQTVSVLEKSYKSSDDKAMNAAYDFYTGSVLPALPFPKPDQFADAQALLGATNDQVRRYKIDSLLDPSFVQDAANRGLGKA